MSQSATKTASRSASKRVPLLCLNCGGSFSDSYFSPCCICPVQKRGATLSEAVELLKTLRPREAA